MFFSFVIDASRAGSSAGSSPATCAPTSSSTRCAWPYPPPARRRRRARASLGRRLAIHQLRVRRSSTTTTCWRRSARSATPTTTRWPRAFVDSFKTELIARPRLANPLAARAGDRRMGRLVQRRAPPRVARRHPTVRVRTAEPAQYVGGDSPLMKRGNQPKRSPRNPARLNPPHGRVEVRDTAGRPRAPPHPHRQTRTRAPTDPPHPQPTKPLTRVPSTVTDEEQQHGSIVLLVDELRSRRAAAGFPNGGAGARSPAAPWQADAKARRRRRGRRRVGSRPGDAIAAAEDLDTPFFPSPTRFGRSDQP